MFVEVGEDGLHRAPVLSLLEHFGDQFMEQDIPVGAALSVEPCHVFDHIRVLGQD